MRVLAVGLALSGLVLVGCAQDSPERSEGRLKVVAAFYPLEEAAKQIGGNRVEVKNLTPPGAEPHDIELTTDQFDDVIDADVVLHVGGGFQPALEEALDRATGVVLDVLDDAPVRAIDDDDDGEADHSGTGPADPHIWLDPAQWAAAAERIARVLTKADPDNAGNYRNGAGVYTDALEELDEEFEEGLSVCDRHIFVTSHASFGYLADRFGLGQNSIAGLSPEAEPDAERLAELADFVEEHDVTTIYYETLVTADVAKTLARETGAEVGVLDPIEGLTSEQIGNGEDYASVMRENLEALRSGLGCR